MNLVPNLLQTQGLSVSTETLMFIAANQTALNGLPAEITNFCNSVGVSYLNDSILISYRETYPLHRAVVPYATVHSCLV